MPGVTSPKPCYLPPPNVHYALAAQRVRGMKLSPRLSMARIDLTASHSKRQTAVPGLKAQVSNSIKAHPPPGGPISVSTEPVRLRKQHARTHSKPEMLQC